MTRARVGFIFMLNHWITFFYRPCHVPWGSPWISAMDQFIVYSVSRSQCLVYILDFFAWWIPDTV